MKTHRIPTLRERAGAVYVALLLLHFRIVETASYMR